MRIKSLEADGAARDRGDRPFSPVSNMLIVGGASFVLWMTIAGIAAFL